MSDKDTVHLSVSVPGTLHKKFRRKCFDKRIPMSQVAVGLIQDWMEGSCENKPMTRCSVDIDAEVYKKFCTLCCERFGVSAEEEIAWYINECVSNANRLCT